MSNAQAPSPERPALGFTQRLRYGIEAAGFFAVIGFFRLFDIETASAIGGWIGRRLIAPSRSSARAQANLRAAYPEKDEAEIARIVRAMWDNLGRVLAEYAHLGKLKYKGSDPRIEAVGLENLRAAQARGRGLLMISGHFANWELMQFAARDYGLEGGVVVRPTNNPYVARWLDGERLRYGVREQIAKGAQGTRRIFSLLRNGECVFMLVDQRTSEGVPAPFFGRDAMTTPAPAALALKLGAVILPICNERLGGARFRMHVYPSIEPVKTGDADRDVLALTAAINAFIEARVRERPEQWLWIHRRWPDAKSKLRKRAQALVGAGERVESEGSSLN